MTMKRTLILAAFPKWALFGLVPVVLILALIMFKIASSFFEVHAQEATLPVVNGEVKVSDGNSAISVSNNSLITPYLHSRLETGRGITNLELWDGSLLIIDSTSTVEFTLLDVNDPGKFYALNLVKGRALVVNQKCSQTPTELFIGGIVSIQVFRAAMGLEVTTDGEVRQRVDCLVGQCLVNGAYPLKSGQYAQIKTDNTVQVAEGVLYDSWISLARASKPSPVLSAIIESKFPTITETVIPTTFPNGAQQIFPGADDCILTSSLSFTPTLSPRSQPTQ
jgi:hypothetical protein